MLCDRPASHVTTIPVRSGVPVQLLPHAPESEYTRRTLDLVVTEKDASTTVYVNFFAMQDGSLLPEVILADASILSGEEFVMLHNVPVPLDMTPVFSRIYHDSQTLHTATAASPQSDFSGTLDHTGRVKMAIDQGAGDSFSHHNGIEDPEVVTIILNMAKALDEKTNSRAGTAFVPPHALLHDDCIVGSAQQPYSLYTPSTDEEKQHMRLIHNNTL